MIMVDQVAQFHHAISENQYEKVKLLLSCDHNLVNCTNVEGLTPLQQACYRGNVELVKYLLQNGANVNAKDLKHGYTALMFAALSGNVDITENLLHYEANTSCVNIIGRTAAEMAAFVGNHHIVSQLNNFIEQDVIGQYARCGDNKSPRISKQISNPLYRIVIGINFTPVKILLLLERKVPHAIQQDGDNAQCDSLLVSHWKAMASVLDDLIDKYFDPHKTHEALALKLHIIACCIRSAGQYHEKTLNALQKPDPSATNTPLSGLIKRFLFGADPHGLPSGQEKFLREILSSFPHQESTLWRMAVTQVGSLKFGQSPTALSVLMRLVGILPAVFDPSSEVNQFCATCGDKSSTSHARQSNTDSAGIEIKLCRSCKEVGYCSVTCQRLHWFTHKKYCRILQEHHEASERSQREARTKD